MTQLTFFRHVIGSEIHGAWYRVLSPHELEVIGIGLLETTSYAGIDPEAAARSVLENFVRKSATTGNPIPPLEFRVPASGHTPPAVPANRQTHR